MNAFAHTFILLFYCFLSQFTLILLDFVLRVLYYYIFFVLLLKINIQSHMFPFLFIYCLGFYFRLVYSVVQCLRIQKL